MTPAVPVAHVVGRWVVHVETFCVSVYVVERRRSRKPSDPKWYWDAEFAAVDQGLDVFVVLIP